MLSKIEITAKDDGSAEILIYDQIGESFWSEGITAKQFAKDIKKFGPVDNIDVRINSPGGSVFEGLAIYNQLKQHPANVHVYIDGIALSMASVIAMAGDEITMAENGLLMVHNPRGNASGESKDLKRVALMMDKARAGMVKAYASRSGSSNEEIEAMLDTETWLDSAESVEAGFVDNVITDAPAMAAHFDMPEGIRIPPHVTSQYYELLGSSEQPKQTLTTKEVKPVATTSTNDTAPAADPAPTGPVAATLSDLKSMEGSTNDFVVEMLDINATVIEAQNELNRRLVAKLKTQSEELAEALKTPPASEGVDALGTDNPDTDAGKSEQLQNPKETYAKLLLEAKESARSSGRTFDLVAASQAIRKSKPELFEAMGVPAQGEFWRQ